MIANMKAEKITSPIVNAFFMRIERFNISILSTFQLLCTQSYFKVPKDMTKGGILCYHENV